MSDITISGLTKRYRGSTAVEDVSFRCLPGTVTGFLGPNGAGKSTTMRMLVGLSSPSAGTATIAGHAYRDLPSPGRTVGVMLDATAQHRGRTGRETLRLAGHMLDVPRRSCDQMLERVGLAGVAGRRVGRYSLGMRQRLGIGVALLGEPRVLVLDEPVNGLDPEGIRWMRRMLVDFAAGGGTVLLSSHLLHEVESVADQLVIISFGRVAAAGDRRELVGDGPLEDLYFRLTGKNDS